MTPSKKLSGPTFDLHTIPAERTVSRSPFPGRAEKNVQVGLNFRAVRPMVFGTVVPEQQTSPGRLPSIRMSTRGAGRHDNGRSRIGA